MYHSNTLNMKPISEVYMGDCKDFMKQFPDKFFDLAVVDPPYFDGPNKKTFYGSEISGHGVKRVEYKTTDKWDIPDLEYYNELIRVSKNQIIWGINYFVDFNNRVGPGRIIWDKKNEQSDYSDCELASCSCIKSVKKFTFMWNGMMQGKSLKDGHIMQGNKKLNQKRIHPTQKPRELYQYCFKNYAKPGFKILDTHMGSQVSRIVAYLMGLDYWGCDITPTYFKDGCDYFDKEVNGVINYGDKKLIQTKIHLPSNVSL